MVGHGLIGMFTKLPARLMVTHMIAKFVFGLGAGILLSKYSRFDLTTMGWVLVLAAVALAIPSTSRLLSEMGKQ